MSVGQIMDLPVTEIEGWVAFLELEAERQKQAMKKR
jgi:hypothetical protein